MGEKEPQATKTSGILLSSIHHQYKIDINTNYLSSHQVKSDEGIDRVHQMKVEKDYMK